MNPKNSPPSSQVTVLGGSGMLGSMLTSYFSTVPDIDLIATASSEDFCQEAQKHVPEAHWKVFQISDQETTASQLQPLVTNRFVINAIGLIPHRSAKMTEDHYREEAERINVLFPHWLKEIAAQNGGKVLQIATDCVYSGKQGSYVESSPHDPVDTYGETKSRGEISEDPVSLLRCSIIGPEVNSHASLLEWFLSQSSDAEVHGFTDHWWNGLTTLAYAKICEVIIREQREVTSPLHLVPADKTSKFDLLTIFQRVFSREDITIREHQTGTRVDRTLSTEHPEDVAHLWAAAGYPKDGPTIAEMVEELAEYSYRLKGAGSR